MLTYNQIEETRDPRSDGKPSLSLQQAARNVGLDFKRCPECKGRGYTKATLLVSMTEVEALARVKSNGTLPIQYDRCERCRGDGGWLLSKRQSRS